MAVARAGRRRRREVRPKPARLTARVTAAPRPAGPPAAAAIRAADLSGSSRAAAASQAAGWWPDADKFQLSKRLTDLGLPVRMPAKVDREQLKNAMKLDKKGQSGAVRLVLLKGLGRPGVLDAASEQVINAGLDAIGA